VRVIGELVGVPESDRDRFRGLVRASATALEPGITNDEMDAADAAMGEMQEYFRASSPPGGPTHRTIWSRC